MNDDKNIFSNKFDIPIGGSDVTSNSSLQSPQESVQRAQEVQSLHDEPVDDLVKDMYAPSDGLFPKTIDARHIDTSNKSELLQGEQVKPDQSSPSEVIQAELPDSLKKVEDVASKNAVGNPQLQSVPNTASERITNKQKGQHVDFGVEVSNLPGFNVSSVMVYPSRWVIISRIIMWTGMVFFILFAFHFLFDWTREFVGSYSRQAKSAVESRPFLLFAGLIFYLIGAAAIAYKWLIMSYEIMSMQIIFTRNGIFGKDRKIYSLIGMEALNLKQGLLGKIFKYGTLHIDKPSFREEEALIGVPDPEKYMVIINNATVAKKVIDAI